MSNIFGLPEEFAAMAIDAIGATRGRNMGMYRAFQANQQRELENSRAQQRFEWAKQQEARQIAEAERKAAQREYLREAARRKGVPEEDLGLYTTAESIRDLGGDPVDRIVASEHKQIYDILDRQDLFRSMSKDEEQQFTQDVGRRTQELRRKNPNMDYYDALGQATKEIYSQGFKDRWFFERGGDYDSPYAAKTSGFSEEDKKLLEKYGVR